MGDCRMKKLFLATLMLITMLSLSAAADALANDRDVVASTTADGVTIGYDAEQRITPEFPEGTVDGDRCTPKLPEDISGVDDASEVGSVNLSSDEVSELWIVANDSVTLRAMLRFGQRVTAHDGATYYESPDLGGSGRSGTANNIYTEDLRIAGFAWLVDGHMVAAECYEREDVPVGSPASEFVHYYTTYTEELWIATYTEGFTTGRVGWFSAWDLSFASPKPSYLPKEKEKPTFEELMGMGAKSAYNDPTFMPEVSDDNGGNPTDDYWYESEKSVGVHNESIERVDLLSGAAELVDRYAVITNYAERAGLPERDIHSGF